ncbi:MAG: DUF2459 domain-containing protein [Pseudomonadota bacterium]
MAALVVALVVTRAPADPSLFPGTGQGVEVHVIDHGYHSGIMLRPADLRAAAVEIGRDDPAAAARLRWLAALFADAEWLEIGWGDAAFYQATPTIGDVDIGLGLSAVLWPTPSVLQVVPSWWSPAEEYPYSEQAALTLSWEGFHRLAFRLAQTIPEKPGPSLGYSLYGHGDFYAAALDYHLFRTCNHWVAWLLRGAGVPASPIPGTFSATLMAELKWRAVAE